MAGTREGGLKAYKTAVKRYGKEFHTKIGAEGGKKSRGGGFAYDDRSAFEKLLKKPTRAQLAGAKGGTISKRRKRNEA